MPYYLPRGKITTHELWELVPKRAAFSRSRNGEQEREGHPGSRTGMGKGPGMGSWSQSREQDWEEAGQGLGARDHGL